MLAWTSYSRQKLLSAESRQRFETARHTPALFFDNEQLRSALLDFIADFANWENSTIEEFLQTSRTLTQAAHEGLGGTLGTRPILVDPFCGGGAIPLEALRVGCEAIASDLNPVAIAINKVILEYIPQHKETVLEQVLKGVDWIQKHARQELERFFLADEDGSTPIAYLWARTVMSEAPEGEGQYPVEVPLLRTMWLARKGRTKKALRWLRNKKGRVKTETVEVRYANGSVQIVRRPLLEVFEPRIESDVEAGTVRKTSATCPVTGFTTPATSVRTQLKSRRGGSSDARLYCVVTTRENETGRIYRMPTERDCQQALAAQHELDRQASQHKGKLPLLPVEPTPSGGGRGAGRAFGQRNYGMNTFADLFTPRQLLALTTYARLAREYAESLRREEGELANAVSACFGLLVDRLADLNASLCVWQLNTPNTAHVFGRWAIQVVMDFGEVNPLAAAGGSPESALRRMSASLENLGKSDLFRGHVSQCSAEVQPLPDDSVQAFITDPPYYDAVPYADLLDFFYVWLKRSLIDSTGILTGNDLTPKSEECIVDEMKGKDRTYFENTMTLCLAEGRRVLQPSGIGVVVFAHKTTSGWESLLQAIIKAGWIITGSWPIDTEMGSRLRAKQSAALASSVHLICRPREHLDSDVLSNEFGDWRDVLAELPHRIHDWMPRLAEEGVVGADAIFACLGPALEIFSRYSHVEKASGEVVMLKEYLEQVWAAVAREALTMIFTGADASGFEEDARLTAMWLWTLKTGDINGTESPEDEEGDDEESAAKRGKTGGFGLEFDAARKIAQGLGAHLENLNSVVEVAGETARLLPVAERAAHLFGKDEGKSKPIPKKKKPQLDLFKGLQVAEETAPAFGEAEVSRVGDTVLDRIHQSMILFAGGRSEALRRFLVDDGAGTDQRFWRLAQALSALYPGNTDEKRWVDGVLARKKGLGL
jgi:adenine-specific DNA methylase